MTNNQDIQAKISNNMLNKVTRLFNASLDDILTELLQNARRAGATAVHLTLNTDDQPTLTLTDNGRGVANPQALLSLGDSGWDIDTLKREDPAGMGVFSLSSRGATIRSNAWEMTLESKHFTGTPVVVTQKEHAIDGTSITMPLIAEEVKTFEQELHEEQPLIPCIRYYPLPVYLNGVGMAQQDFLDDAVFVESWQGLRLGVVRKRYRENSLINFHGLVLEHALPDVEAFTIHVDVIDAPVLQMVLPARKEIVHNDFAKALQEQCLRVLYRYFASLDTHTLSYEHWLQAKTLGVSLPEAKPELETFQARVADTVIHADKGGMCAVNQHNVVVTDCFEGGYEHSPDENCFAQALAWHSEAGGLEYYTFVRPNPDYVGYRWYDALPKLSNVTFVAQEQVKKTGAGGDTVVEGITITCYNGVETVYTGAAPVCFAWDEDYFPYPSLCEFTTTVADGHGFDVRSLSDVLQSSFFCFDENCSADSYETQLEGFSKEAYARSMALLLSADDATLHQLEEHARQIQWRLPPNRIAMLRISYGGVKVRLLPSQSTE